MKQLGETNSSLMQSCLLSGAHRVAWTKPHPTEWLLSVELWKSQEDRLQEHCRVQVRFSPKEKVPAWQVSGAVGFQVSVVLINIDQFASWESALAVVQWGMALGEGLSQEIKQEPLEWI